MTRQAIADLLARMGLVTALTTMLTLFVRIL